MKTKYFIILKKCNLLPWRPAYVKKDTDQNNHFDNLWNTKMRKYDYLFVQ